MKVFSKKKFAHFEPYVPEWAEKADGFAVRNGEIPGTKVPAAKEIIDKWCVDYEPKPGDRVKLRDDRGKSWNVAGLMDCYKAAIVTIAAIDPDGSFYVCGGIYKIGDDLVYEWRFDIVDVVQVIDFVDTNDYDEPKDEPCVVTSEMGADRTVAWPDPRAMHIQLDPGAHMPTRAHEDDAGLDLYAMEAQTVPAHGSAVFDAGVHVQLPANTAGMLKSKSGLNVKHNITSEGVIDVSYTGGIVVKLYNHGGTDYRVEKGDKLSQLVIVPILRPKLEVVAHLDETERGNNGFGSSGR